MAHLYCITDISIKVAKGHDALIYLAIDQFVWFKITGVEHVRETFKTPENLRRRWLLPVRISLVTVSSSQIISRILKHYSQLESTCWALYTCTCIYMYMYMCVVSVRSSCQCVRRVSAFVVSARSSCQCVRRVSAFVVSVFVVSVRSSCQCVASVRIARLATHVLNKKHVILTFQIEFCICVHSSVLS